MIPARHVPSSTGRRGRQTRRPKAARAAPAAASAWARDRSGPAVAVPGGPGPDVTRSRGTCSPSVSVR